MTTQHTPGPWYALAEGVADAAIGYRAVINSDGYTVCNPSPMGEANARLISAAPDLLAALQDLLAATEETYDSRHERQAALDAINKATGEQP